MIYPSKPPSRLMQPRNWQLQYLADNMREDEKTAWCALTGATQYNADTAAEALITTTGIRFVLMGDKWPVVAGGFEKERGNAWAGWMVGTDEGWRTDWRGITRAARWLMGQMFAQGATRLSITTTQARVGACDWYAKALGMQCDAVLRHAGANGETLVVYSRIQANSHG